MGEFIEVKVHFNRPGPRAGSIHSIDLSVCLFVCLSVCLFAILSRPIYFLSPYIKRLGNWGIGGLGDLGIG